MNAIQLSPPNRQLGFGLVEILVALTVSLFLIAGVGQIYVSNKQSYRLAEGMSRLQENWRFSMKNLSAALEPGDYQGCLGAAADNFVNTLTNQSGPYDYGASVNGTDGGVANPDSVTLSRAVGVSSIAVTEPMASQTAPIQLDDTDPDYANLEQYQILTISDCARAATFMITNDPQTSGGTIEHQVGITAPTGGLNAGQSNATTDLQHIFGAKTNAVATVYSTTSTTYALGPDAEGDLWLLANNQQLVEGVRDLQITYGLPGNMQFVPASAGLDWSAVESMRVALTLDTVEPITVNGTEMVERQIDRTFRIRNRNP